MTKRQEQVLAVLETARGVFQRPIDINKALGLISRGSWVSRVLLSLVKEGVAERNARGHYRMTQIAEKVDVPLNLDKVERPISVA